MSKKVCKECEWRKAFSGNSIHWCMDHMPPVRMGYRETYTPKPLFRTTKEMFAALDNKENI